MVPTQSLTDSSTEALIRLAYELLDAHEDTSQLTANGALDERWQAHLNYLRSLQRTGREALAHVTAAAAHDSACPPAREPAIRTAQPPLSAGWAQVRRGSSERGRGAG